LQQGAHSGFGLISGYGTFAFKGHGGLYPYIQKRGVTLSEVTPRGKVDVGGGNQNPDFHTGTT
jgi:hypothetical protein